MMDESKSISSQYIRLDNADLEDADLEDECCNLDTSELGPLRNVFLLGARAGDELSLSESSEVCLA